MSEFDLLIAGSGLFGSTFTHLANRKGKRCIVIEKRPHHGRNVYYKDVEDIHEICSLLQKLMVGKKAKASVLAIASTMVLLNFIFVWHTDIVFDPTHAKDKSNLEEIALSCLDPSEPTVKPYSWYYYVIESDENVFFQWSGEYPESLTRVIYDPSDESNNPVFMQSCEYSHTLISMEEWIINK